LKLNYGAALGDILKIMGMAEAFSKEANFKRISADTLYISEVLHKTFVQIDEEGTEAAAVTAVIMMTTESCEPMLENLTLRIDRPFVFAIYHRPSGAIIFAGKIENPVWED